MTRRRAAWRMRIAAAGAAAAGIVGAAREARASPADVGLGIAAGLGAATLAADIVFAANGLMAADAGYLRRDDGWLVAQTIVTAPQTVGFNALLMGFNAAKSRTEGDIAMLIGIVPTISVSALTTHAIWGMTEERVPADALAGVSVLVGTNIALTSGALGRAFTGRLHSRWVGTMEMAATAPGLGIGVYESTFARNEQGAWIALTAWSGALFVHGMASAIVGQADRSWRQQQEEQEGAGESGSGSGRGGRQSAGWRLPVTVAPSVVSDGVARVPGVVVAGVF